MSELSKVMGDLQNVIDRMRENTRALTKELNKAKPDVWKCQQLVNEGNTLAGLATLHEYRLNQVDPGVH